MVCTSVRESVVVSEEGWLIVVVWTTAPLGDGLSIEVAIA